MRPLQESNSSEKFNPSSSLPLENISRRFSLDEILAATNNFNDSLVIGQGGFAKVYKGEIDNGAHTVAIKRMNPMSKEDAPEFRTEILMVSKFQHSHLVSLIGYCESENEMILVYDYMAHGTLEDNLHKVGTSGYNNVTICWAQRLKICIGAARGLEYLHTGTGVQHRVIHRDVKSSNILLDENWAAKISDFGMSKIGPANQSNTYVSTRVVGTFGYLDPDYAFTGSLTRKSDVYSFGVILFEVLCGRPALDRRLLEDQWSLSGWAHYCVKKGLVKQIIDPNLKSQITPRSLSAFVKVADRCLHARPKERPTMTEVLADLEFALNLQESTKVASGFAKKLQLLFSVTPRPISAEEDPEVHPGQLRRFSLHELQVATDSFSNRNILGRGGFGKVYKGCLADGTLVALIRLKKERTQGWEIRFQMEVKMFSIAVHHNLRRLRGFCMTPTERVLVYPYMANGSVASCLRERPELQSPLDWTKRKQIALGSARGLVYLHDHCDPKVIHRDIKASNIFLDEEFEAVVGDFGLAMLMDYKDTHVIGHIAPEYLFAGKISEKTDVFGYGVMLLELITGQRAYDPARIANDDDVMLLDWVKGLLKKKKLETLVDADLNGNYIDDEVEQLIQVALLCTQGSQTKRPKMSNVVKMLEGDGLSKSWEEWQKDEVFRQVQ